MCYREIETGFFQASGSVSIFMEGNWVTSNHDEEGNWSKFRHGLRDVPIIFVQQEGKTFHVGRCCVSALPRVAGR